MYLTPICNRVFTRMHKGMQKSETSLNAYNYNSIRLVYDVVSAKQTQTSTWEMVIYQHRIVERKFNLA